MEEKKKTEPVRQQINQQPNVLIDELD